VRWGDEPNRCALLELWATGALRKLRRNGEAWDELQRLPWTRLTGRSGELTLVPERRPELEQLLDGCWPEWRQVAAGSGRLAIRWTRAGGARCRTSGGERGSPGRPGHG